MRDFSYLNIQDKQELLKYLLSPKEFETVNFVLQGMKNEQISEQMGIKLKTVKHNLTCAYRILGAKGWREIYKWFHGKPAGFSCRVRYQKNAYQLITEEKFIEVASQYKNYSEMPSSYRKWVDVYEKKELVKECFPHYEERDQRFKRYRTSTLNQYRRPY
jgi:DNA-binding CsgD family transcriptional regulator